MEKVDPDQALPNQCPGGTPPLPIDPTPSPRSHTLPPTNEKKQTAVDTEEITFLIKSTAFWK